MAIIIEEERHTSEVFRLAAWFVILLILAVAIYYIFFTAPELVVIPPSGNLSNIAPIADSPLTADDVVNSPAFQALRKATIPPVSSSTEGGRTNPFIAPF